ncbi:hypothetical protein SAMN05428978_1002112 [Nitrosomonas sp. Nm34]|nr:hypothetical protein SAMN05428978_1002112 [Nitrosomonas sp. Nm34]
MASSTMGQQVSLKPIDFLAGGWKMYPKQSMINKNRREKRSLSLINEHFEPVPNLMTTSRRKHNWFFSKLLHDIKNPGEWSI